MRREGSIRRDQYHCGSMLEKRWVSKSQQFRVAHDSCEKQENQGLPMSHSLSWIQTMSLHLPQPDVEP